MWIGNLRSLIALVVVLSLQACAHGGLSNPTSLENIRKECQSNDGIFHLIYSDYFHGWRADTAKCWYGATAADLERIEALSSESTDSP